MRRHRQTTNTAILTDALAPTTPLHGMKYLILLVCLLHHATANIRRGAKRSASSASATAGWSRGRPKLFREDLNVCVCVGEDGTVLPWPSSPAYGVGSEQCDPLDIDCDAPDDVLSFNCYEDLMDLETSNPTFPLLPGHQHYPGSWANLRSDIIQYGLTEGAYSYTDEDLEIVFGDFMSLGETCFAELEKMVKAEEERIQETPAFQATLSKLVIKGSNYRRVVVDIVGPSDQVSYIAIEICFKKPNSNDNNNYCSYIARESFAKEISHTIAPSDFGLRIADDGAVKVMGKLLGSEAMFTANKYKIDLTAIGGKMHEFLEGGDGTTSDGTGKRIADIVINTLFGISSGCQPDVFTKTYATATVQNDGKIVMLQDDILIGGMSLWNF